MGFSRPFPNTSKQQLQLPNELWEAIFELAIISTPENPKQQSSPIVIAAVCTTWRAIVLGLPKLWTSVDIVIHLWTTSTQTPLLETWITRARGLPLNIKLTFSYPESNNTSVFSGEKSLNVLRTLAHRANEIVSLDTIMSLHWQDFIAKERLVFPNITTLQFRSLPTVEQRKVWDPKHPPLILKDHFPILSDLRFEASAPYLGVVGPLEQLKKLTSHHSDPLHCGNVFSKCTIIEELSFLESPVGRGSARDFTDSALPTLASGTRQMHSLRRLNLSSSANPPYSVARHLRVMSSGDIPLRALNLHSFRARHKSFWMHEDLVPQYHAMLIRLLPKFSETLQELTMVDSVFDEDPLVEILALLPELRLLEVEAPGIVLTDVLMTKLGTKSRKAHPLLPHLESVTLSGSLRFSDNEFFSFIESRRRIPGDFHQPESFHSLYQARLQFQNVGRAQTDAFIQGCKSLIKEGFDLSVMLERNNSRPMLVMGI